MKYHKNGREDAAATKLIVEQGAVCTLNLFRTQEGLTAADVIEGFDVSAYSFHSNYDRSNHVLRDTRIYYPSSRAGIEDMEKKALGYIEIHGLETYTLSEDVEIPVFDGTTPATVDMHATKLVVPAGKSVLVNGTLAVRELVIESGGSVTVNGTFISIPRDEPDNNHNGALILTQNDGIDPMLTVTDTGIVGGTDCSIELPQGTTDPTRYVSGINPGQLKVVSDPYRPFKIYAVAPELHLPESLNKIESEAFAGGSFSSVYIPAGVSSIASDAFGDMTGLKVYGEYGTEAAQFASDHHFPFAPLVWRGNQ